MTNGWGYNHMSGGVWALMIFLMIIFWVVVVIGVVAFMRRSPSTPTTSASSSPSSDMPEQVLRARFARGEIDDAELRTRMAALKEHQ
jgi:putative membrane protein